MKDLKTISKDNIKYMLARLLRYASKPYSYLQNWEEELQEGKFDYIQTDLITWIEEYGIHGAPMYLPLLDQLDSEDTQRLEKILDTFYDLLSGAEETFTYSSVICLNNLNNHELTVLSEVCTATNEESALEELLKKYSHFLIDGWFVNSKSCYKINLNNLPFYSS